MFDEITSDTAGIRAVVNVGGMTFDTRSIRACLVCMESSWLGELAWLVSHGRDECLDTGEVLGMILWFQVAGGLLAIEFFGVYHVRVSGETCLGSR